MWSYPVLSSCFISSKTTFSPRGLPAPPLFILLFHIFKNGIFTELPAPPLFILLFHIFKNDFFEGYRLHPFSSSCFISSRTTFFPRGLPAPPLFILLFHIFKSDIFTARVTGSTPFHPLVSYLQKRLFRGLPAPPLFILLFHIFKNDIFTELPAPPLFILLFHIFKNDIFTARVTGSTPFHPLVSYLQKRHFHRGGYRLHPFSSSCFISSKPTFSPRGLPAPLLFMLLLRGLLAPPLFILLFHFFKDGISPRGLPAPPLFILLFHIFKNSISPTELPAPPLFIRLVHTCKNGIFTERVTGSTPFHPLVSYLQKRHFNGEGYRLHPFSSSCFISSKTTFSPRGLPAPPLFTLLFHIFKNDIFTERVTGSTPFHPLVSYLQKQHFHREGYRVHPFSSSCFISSQTTFSPRGLPAPPLFILLLHIFENDIFTERVTGSTPFHPLASYLRK